MPCGVRVPVLQPKGSIVDVIGECIGVDIQTEEIGTITVLTVQGALTVDHGVTTLRSLIREMVDSGRSRVVLDLGAVDYMDSLGLEALITASTAIEEQGGRLALAGMKPRLKHLIEITRLGEIFETHENRTSAVDSLTGTSAP
jgi:anti-sigma B factor antagonist